jgi:FlaA1/EpsC-like NDP-sugar epimerase
MVRREVPLVVMDLAVVFVAYLIPLVLRFDGAVPSQYWTNFRLFIGAAAIVHLLANYLLGLYAQMWRYASVQEARRVVLSGLLAGVFVVGTGFVFSPRPLPMSVLIAGPGLSLFGFGAIRFQSRLFGFRRREAAEQSSRLLVVGAGEAGAMIVKDILENPSLGLDPVAFVDDAPRKLRISLRGVQVMGPIGDIPTLAGRLFVDEVLFAIPSASGDVVRRVAVLCEEANLPLRVLPSKRDIVSGRVTARDIRDLRIEDLLGRGEVETDLASVAAMLRGKRVLVTGAGGSIGSEIARQVAAFEPSALLLLDHDETHLHDLLLDLAGHAVAKVVLADVRDRDRLWRLLSEARPEVVFHAAAHKHVPLLEAHPEEAVLTNVLGTANVADAAVAAGAARFVLISTDKGINPINVMGISKWFAERIVGSLRGNGCSFCSVRFGNVLGSRGSVIPTFIRQIAHGGPVTVTDPSMARYFMSVQEAVQLVLQAASLSEGGEVFTLDMGEPVNIMDLARRVIRLSGRVPDRDVAIQVVGPRPGEKMAEEITDPAEELLESAHPAIRVARPLDPDPVGLRAALQELEMLANAGDAVALAARMRSLVAESNGHGDAGHQPEPAHPEEAIR